jgi:two-component system, LuxR family, response regulator FixJ
MGSGREPFMEALEPGETERDPKDSGEIQTTMSPVIQPQPLPPVPQVFIVDDDLAIREWLEVLLNAAGHSVVSFASAPAFLEAYSKDQPGCLVLDIRMPEMSGIELQAKLKERDALLPVIFITSHGDIPIAVEAMRSGAVDFLLKPFRDNDLLDRVRQALAIDAANQAERSELAAVRDRIACLTPRELEVMHLVVQGKANKVIATDLNLSQRTVEIHRARVMDKMAATSLAHLVRMVLDVEAG